MAKKTVATLHTNNLKKITKVIRMVKSQKSKVYVFEEKILNSEEVDNFFRNNK